jgi:hypothetical protein
MSEVFITVGAVIVAILVVFFEYRYLKPRRTKSREPKE